MYMSYEAMPNSLDADIVKESNAWKMTNNNWNYKLCYRVMTPAGKLMTGRHMLCEALGMPMCAKSSVL